MPNKLNLYTNDRDILIKYIKYCWKIYFIQDKSICKEFPEYKADVESIVPEQYKNVKNEGYPAFLYDNKMYGISAFTDKKFCGYKFLGNKDWV